MNETRGVDRRIYRTRVMIYEAFLKMMKKQDYVEISIVDIAEQANINRSTFYAHFIDKEDLLDKMVNEKLELLEHVLSERSAAMDVALSFTEPDPIFAVLFEHIFEHDEFYRVMLLINPVGNFSTRLNEVIKTYFFNGLPNSGWIRRFRYRWTFYSIISASPPAELFINGLKTTKYTLPIIWLCSLPVLPD